MTNEDDLKQAAKAAWGTRIDAPVAELVDDTVSVVASTSKRLLSFVGPESGFTVSLRSNAEGALAVAVESPTTFAAVELWAPDGPVGPLTRQDSAWTTVTSVTGPVRVVMTDCDGPSKVVRLQSEWFALP